MRYFLSVALIVFLGMTLCAPKSVRAQESPKIGYVDVKDVFDAYDKAKGISKLLEAEKDKTKKEYSEKEQKIKEENRKFREKASEMEEEEKEKRRKSIEGKVRELIKFERVRKDEEQKPIRKALAEIYKAVETVGKREGYDLIIDKREGLFGRTILFARKSLSLTDKVIVELLKKKK